MAVIRQQFMNEFILTPRLRLPTQNTGPELFQDLTTVWIFYPVAHWERPNQRVL